MTRGIGTVVNMCWSTLSPGRVRIPALAWLVSEESQTKARKKLRERGELRKSEAEEPAIVAENQEGGRKRRGEKIPIGGGAGHNP